MVGTRRWAPPSELHQIETELHVAETKASRSRAHLLVVRTPRYPDHERGRICGGELLRWEIPDHQVIIPSRLSYGLHQGSPAARLGPPSTPRRRPQRRTPATDHRLTRGLWFLSRLPSTTKGAQARILYSGWESQPPPTTRDLRGISLRMDAGRARRWPMTRVCCDSDSGTTMELTNGSHLQRSERARRNWLVEPTRRRLVRLREIAMWGWRVGPKCRCPRAWIRDIWVARGEVKVGWGNGFWPKHKYELLFFSLFLSFFSFNYFSILAFIKSRFWKSGSNLDATNKIFPAWCNNILLFWIVLMLNSWERKIIHSYQQLKIFMFIKIFSILTCTQN
jgi:hypothetical protein